MKVDCLSPIPVLSSPTILAYHSLSQHDTRKPSSLILHRILQQEKIYHLSTQNFKGILYWKQPFLLVSGELGSWLFGPSWTGLEDNILTKEETKRKGRHRSNCSMHKCLLAIGLMNCESQTQGKSLSTNHNILRLIYF